MTGSMIGLCLGVGVLLAVTSLVRSRRPTLDQRVVPYVRDVHPAVVRPSTVPGAAGAIFGPTVDRLASVVGDVLGGSTSVTRRLDRLGERTTVDDFRIRQVLWGAAGLSGATALALVLWSSGAGSGPALLVLCGFGFVVGVLACDRRLASRVQERESRLQAEFPVVAELLALSVAAGEGPVAGLERIMRVCHDSLADELGRVLSDIRTGTSMAAAFDRLAARTGVTSIARFAEGLAVAIERGTPLVDVLHAQASDVRDAGRRELMEAGGRKEVAMMIPVVFLILPVTIVFAFFPGYIGLHLSSGG